MNKVSASIVGITLAATLVLGGCKKADTPETGETGTSLADQIVVDPDATGEGGNIALSPASLTPQAVAEVRKSAAELAGGLKPVPTRSRAARRCWHKRRPSPRK